MKLDGKYSERVQYQLKQNLGVDIILPDRYFDIHVPIVTKHKLGLPFPHRNLPIKFGTNPSTIFLVIVVTVRHTDKPMPLKHNSHAFAGRIRREMVETMNWLRYALGLSIYNISG